MHFRGEEYEKKLNLLKVTLWQAMAMRKQGLMRSLFDRKLLAAFERFNDVGHLLLQWELNRLVNSHLQFHYEPEELQFIFDALGIRNYLIEEPDYERWRDDAHFFCDGEEDPLYRRGTTARSPFSDYYKTGA